MSIRQLLLTGRGERVMRPDVGSQIERFVFEPNEDLRAELIAAEVMEVLSRYEPRILVTGVETITEDESVIVTIGYVVRATGQPQTQGVSIPVPPRE